MNSMTKGLIIALLAAMSVGCAFQKQAIKLQPVISASSTNIGDGKLTMVNVTDERPRTTLGTRGVGGIGEQLTLQNDLASTVKESVIKGLQAQGFATNGPMENQLRVEIRNLDYTVNSGFWAGKLNIEFLLKGICIKGANRPYEQMYRGEVHKNIQVVQGADSNTEYVNDVVSQAINALLNDQQLLRCLS